jgi:hypothetical protein
MLPWNTSGLSKSLGRLQNTDTIVSPTVTFLPASYVLPGIAVSISVTVPIKRPSSALTFEPTSSVF